MRLPQHRVLPLLVGITFVAGCMARGDIEELKKNQKDILAKLDQIDKKVQGGAMRPQQPPQPQGPDPSKVYAFPVGQSPIKGAKDALVTIVEVSDFQ